MKISNLVTLLLAFLCICYGSFAKGMQDNTGVVPTREQDPEKEIQEVEEFTIENPIIRPLKLMREFSEKEKKLYSYWFLKKKELANIHVLDKRKQFANDLADEMADLSDREFAFLSTQPYFWTDIIGVEPRAFSASLSPKKLRIAGDAVANRSLIFLEKNIPIYIEKLIAYLDLSDPMILEKLEAFLPAATVLSSIDAAVEKRARAFRQQMYMANDKENWRRANTLIRRIDQAKKIRLAKLMALPKAPVEVAKKAPEEKQVEPQKETFVEVVKTEEAVQKPEVAVDLNWRETKPAFGDWLESDYDVSKYKLDEVKDNIKFLLKIFPSSTDETEATLKEAFVKTMAQSNSVNRLFDLIKDVSDENDLAVFMTLLQGKGEDKPSEPYLIDKLWESEKSLIIAGKSVRDQQEKRLAIFFRNMDEGQLLTSMMNIDFWKLLEDQPQAAAMGLQPEHYKLLAKYFLNNIRKDKFKVIGFANKVVTKLNEEQDPDHVYAALLALAPLAKHIPAYEQIISLKSTPLGRLLKHKYGLNKGSDMIMVLKKAMR